MVKGEGLVKAKLRILIIGMLMLCLTACNKEKEETHTEISPPETKVTKTEEIGSRQELAAIAPADRLEGKDMDNPAGMLQESSASVMVQILAGNLKGSGVIAYSNEEEVWIMTAAHVLANMEETVKITFYDGYVVEAKDIDYMETQDMAVIKLPRKALVCQSSDEIMDHGQIYRTVILERDAFDASGTGDLVIAMGSKSGVAQEAYAGVILKDYVFLEDFGAYMILADVFVTPGMSGGGLFDAKGRLLGILCGISEDGEVAVAPVTAILAMLDL